MARPNPANPSSTYINRPGTYTIAYLIRRARYEPKELPELTVVVFSQRNIDLAEGENPLWANATGTGITAVSGSAGANSVAISYTGTAPIIRRRSWVLDVTQNSRGYINGYFYRVENVAETGVGSVTLELDRPLKEDASALVHFRDVIAAVERGTTWLP